LPACTCTIESGSRSPAKMDMLEMTGYATPSPESGHLPS
jgi:hypothetical protein